MWATAHAACGAALSTRIRNPWALAGAAVASHVVLDWIPHWDYPAFWLYGAADLAGAILVVALLFRPDRLAWWGAFWAAVPDLEVVLAVFGLATPRFPSHRPWFPHGSAPMLPGIVIQVSVIVFFVVFARRAQKKGW